jgi:trans-2,3-dihydro-3-hydroxyanthranilate isomerase
VRHCYVLSVFTRQGAGGNLLGVVTDVSGLPDVTMQSIATDLGFSETIFVDWRQGGLPVVRIFTPALELPFAGHPLVGAAWVLSVLGPGGPGRIRCEVGEVSYRRSADTMWVECGDDQPLRAVDPPIGFSPLSTFSVDMPITYTIMQLASAAEVASTPAASVPTDTYVWGWVEGSHDVKARFFAPALGVDEDPATGSAAVALARVLSTLGMATGSITVYQGDEIGSPSSILLDWSPGKIAIGGEVRRLETRELAV